MARYKYTDSVSIQISGPKTVLPEPIMTMGRLGMTWLHFLNTTCGLQLDNNSDYFICTSTYSTTDPESGWTASLNDQIKPFIDKYSRKRAKYCVRLHTGSEPPSSTSNTANATSTTTTTNSWTPSILRKPTVTVTSPAKKFAAVVPLTPSQVSEQLRKPAVTGQVFVRPTPAIVIPTRGSQVITQIQPATPTRVSQVVNPIQPQTRAPIQPVIPQPQTPPSASRTTASSSQGQSSSAAFKTQRNNGATQNISEVSIGIGRGPRKITGNGESSPPKLARFNQSEQQQQRNKNAARNEPQPSTSAAAAAAAAASLPGTSLNNRPRRISRPTRRFEEDSFPSIMSVAACKIEPIEIELDEVTEMENGDLHQQQVLDALGIEDDDEEEEGQGQNGVNAEDEIDDNMSVCTAASVEEQDLVQAGIPIRDIKSLIDRRLDRFDNSMLQRIQNEIKKLKQKGQWDRNVKRSPLACYLLQEVFKEPM